MPLPRHPRGRRPFAYLGSATAAVNLGAGTMVAVLPLVAVWVTDNPVLVAAVTALHQAPFVVFGLLAGVLADRVSRRTLLLVATAVRVGVLVLLAALAAAGTLDVVAVCLLVFVLGTGDVLYDVTAQSLVPQLVEPAYIPTANSWIVSSEVVVGRFVGPSLGGFLFAVVAAPFVFAATLLTAALWPLIRLPGQPPAVEREDRRRVLSEIVAGLRWLWSNSLLRSITLLSALVNFFTSAWYSILVVFAIRELDIPEAWFGVLLAVSGVGGIVGSVTARLIARRFDKSLTIPVIVMLIGGCQAMLGGANGAIYAGGLLVVYGLLDTLWMILTTSLRQELVPTQLLGRVNAAYRTVGRGAAPLGAMTGGALAAITSIQVPFFLGTPVLIMAGCLAMLLALRLRRQRPS